jgi:hypothetical protein
LIGLRTWAELAVETLLPADNETAQRLRALHGTIAAS